MMRLRGKPPNAIPGGEEVTRPMSWKPSADIDEKVRRWMKAKGWEMTSDTRSRGQTSRLP